MARKNKRPVMDHAEVVADASAFNPRIAGDIYRWRKQQEEYRKKGEQVFSNTIDLKGVRVHKNVVRFSCRECGKKFDLPDGLQTHRRMKHGIAS